MADKPHIMIVEARYYEDIGDALAEGAIGVLDQEGASYERVTVPGAFEIPAAIRMAVRSKDFFTARPRFDGYIVLGCVIRGETSHYDVVCNESSRGIQSLILEHTLALGFGLLTVENREQAMARAAPKTVAGGGNKGAEAARACLRMIELKRDFRLYPR